MDGCYWENLNWKRFRVFFLTTCFRGFLEVFASSNLRNWRVPLRNSPPTATHNHLIIVKNLVAKWLYCFAYSYSNNEILADPFSIASRTPDNKPMGYLSSCPNHVSLSTGWLIGFPITDSVNPNRLVSIIPYNHQQTGMVWMI